MKAIARHWTEFVQIPVTDEMLRINPLLKNAVGVYQNSRFQVELWNVASEVGGVVQLVARKHLGDAITWDELFRIKNEIFTTQHTAVELYPPADSAWSIQKEVRILWVLPLSYVPPYGLHLAGAWGVEA